MDYEQYHSIIKNSFEELAHKIDRYVWPLGKHGSEVSRIEILEAIEEFKMTTFKRIATNLEGKEKAEKAFAAVGKKLPDKVAKKLGSGSRRWDNDGN